MKHCYNTYKLSVIKLPALYGEGLFYHMKLDMANSLRDRHKGIQIRYSDKEAGEIKDPAEMRKHEKVLCRTRKHRTWNRRCRRGAAADPYNLSAVDRRVLLCEKLAEA